MKEEQFTPSTLANLSNCTNVRKSEDTITSGAGPLLQSKKDTYLLVLLEFHDEFHKWSVIEHENIDKQ